ncbi:MAG: stage III sporulation protein AD [Oscillospiraceae bacterium]|nr:stage III sporulation protein AD [Oscillospiraceae bacterium]
MGLKLAAAAIVAALAALVVRQVKPEFAMFAQLGGVMAVGLIMVSILQELLGLLEGLLASTQGMEGSFSLLAKALGICVTTQLAADLCCDSGSTALANLVELGGRLLVLALAVPLLKSIAELAIGLIRG